MTKQKRHQIIDTRKLDIDYVSLESAIKMLTEAMEEGYTQVEFEVETGYYDSHTAVFTVTKQREETDQEYETRLLKEKYWQEKRRTEYERLKKEFGDA
jgi:hypothetical protein